MEQSSAAAWNFVSEIEKLENSTSLNFSNYAQGAYCKSGKSTAGVQSYLVRLLRHTHISTPVADGLMNLQ